MRNGDGRELIQCEVDLFGGVRRHQARPQAALRRRHGGRHDRVGEDAGVEQLAPEHERLLERPDQDRNDGRLGVPDVVALLAQALLEPARVVPQALAPFRLVAQDLERREHARGVRGGQRRGEDQRATVVLEVVDDVLVAGHVAADGRQ